MTLFSKSKLLGVIDLSHVKWLQIHLEESLLLGFQKELEK